MEKLLGLPVLASDHGKDVDQLTIYVHWLMIVLFVGWLAYFAYALFRFRASRNPKADYIGVRNHASNYIELAVAGVEAFLLIGLAIPLWARTVDKFPKETESTVLRVSAQQFAWNIRYPGADGLFGKQNMKLVSSDNPLGMDLTDENSKDDFQKLNEMRVPVNKPVVVHLTSKDVIHSFKIPTLRVTQDAIPGMSIPMWFNPTMEGRFQINCAQLCGNGHYAMAQGFLVVESQEKYNEWFASQTKTAGEPVSYE